MSVRRETATAVQDWSRELCETRIMATTNGKREEKKKPSNKLHLDVSTIFRVIITFVCSLWMWM